MDTYVTANSGTGLVHSAPAFGEDDYRVSLANGELASFCSPRRFIRCCVRASRSVKPRVKAVIGMYSDLDFKSVFACIELMTLQHCHQPTLCGLAILRVSYYCCCRAGAGDQFLIREHVSEEIDAWLDIICCLAGSCIESW